MRKNDRGLFSEDHLRREQTFRNDFSNRRFHVESVTLGVIDAVFQCGCVLWRQEFQKSFTLHIRTIQFQNPLFFAYYCDGFEDIYTHTYAVHKSMCQVRSPRTNCVRSAAWQKNLQTRERYLRFRTLQKPVTIYFLSQRTTVNLWFCQASSKLYLSQPVVKYLPLISAREQKPQDTQQVVLVWKICDGGFVQLDEELFLRH